MKLSILMTTYNRPKLLRRALASIKNQVFDDYEVILINDAGRSVSRIVKESKIRDIKLIDNVSNTKPTFCFNQAFSLSSGDLIIQLDDDDEFTTFGISKIVKLFEKHTVQSVFARGYRIKSNIEKEIYPPYSEEITIEKMKKRNWCVSCSRMIDAFTLDMIGGFDESLSVLVDWDLNLKLVLNHKYAIDDTVVSIVHLSDNSWKRSHEELVKKEYEIIRRRYCQK